MFGMGLPELMVIFVIALLVFGPKKLPELGKSIGRAMAEFKKAQQEFQESIQAEMKDVEKKTDLEGIKKLAALEPQEEQRQLGGPSESKLNGEQKPGPDSAGDQKKGEEATGNG